MCNFLYFSLSRKGDETMEVRGCWVSNMELSLSGFVYRLQNFVVDWFHAEYPGESDLLKGGVSQETGCAGYSVSPHHRGTGGRQP